MVTRGTQVELDFWLLTFPEIAIDTKLNHFLRFDDENRNDKMNERSNRTNASSIKNKKLYRVHCILSRHTNK